MDINYKFVTIKELAERICKENPLDHIIGFTFDQPEDVEMNGEPTGWYGITMSSMFDGESIVIGYWGGGICAARNIWRDVSEAIDFIIEFYKSECHSIVDENTQICVDANEFDLRR